MDRLLGGSAPQTPRSFPLGGHQVLSVATCRMAAVCREDRALLESNPSALQMAVGRIGAPLSVEAAVAALPAGPALVLGLEGLSNTDNVGALFRNGAAFGVNLLLLDPGSADPLYRKAIRTSMGHALVLPFARTPPWPAGLEALRAAGFVTYALTPRAEATSVIELFRGGLPREERVALLVGAEGPGLSAATLAAVDRGLRIPMSAGVDSLNVATAAALGLFALRAR